MMFNDPSDDALDHALTSLPRVESPSPAFTSRVMHDLSRRGLVHEPRLRRHWLAAAATIFVAGLAAGAGASLLQVREAEASVNVPPIGHSEAWF